MKKQRATARIVALFQQERYPDGFPAAADPEALDEEFRAWFDRRVNDPDVVQLLEEAEIDGVAEELENALSAPDSGFFSTMHVKPDGTLMRLWRRLEDDRRDPLPPTN